MTTDRHFRELRLRLVDLHRSLRHLKDDCELAKATAEQNAIDRNQASGKNAEERARSLLLVIQHDNAYISARANLRDCEYECERVEQLIEAAKDERRATEWQIRAKLADGLFRQQVQSDSADPLGDSAFDDTLLSLTNRLAALALRKDFQYRDVAREMIDAYNNGMADRINGAGEYEEDDGYVWDDVNEHQIGNALDGLF